jgi:hypothetical protein
MDNYPEASVAIEKEIHSFLNTRRFRAMEQYLDVENEAEVQKHCFII